MRRATFPWITIFFVLALFGVLWFSWGFMDRITSVLERKNTFRDDVVTTDVVCKCQNSVASKVCDVEKIKDHDSAIIAAYDSLSNELSSWMSIMGIFSVVFGLLVPIGSYLLQHKSLRDEREELKKEMDDRVDRKITEREKEVINRVEKAIKPTWRFLGASFQHIVFGEANKMLQSIRSKEFDDTGKVVSVVNFFISFDIYLDCMVRAGDATAVITACKEFKPYFENFRSNEKMWDNFISLYRNGLQKCDDFVSGSAFAKLIGKDNEWYQWLKGLYNEIIPWKFS